jgi:hypothetical protein
VSSSDKVIIVVPAGGESHTVAEREGYPFAAPVGLLRGNPSFNIRFTESAVSHLHGTGARRQDFSPLALGR